MLLCRSTSRGAQGELPQLRDVGHHQPGLARRSRRAQAVAAADPGGDARPGSDPGGSTSKCAGIVGETMKRYHPHGDNSIYPTLARMAQWWNMRHLLITGQGNFGSDPRPAAGGHAVHRGQAQPGRRRDARGHQARHRRLPAQLRREVPGAAGPARQVSQPAGQRLRRHRRRHGDVDPAAQPGRGLRRPDRLYRRPGDRARRAHGDHPGPRLPHRRAPSAAGSASARPIAPAGAGSSSAPSTRSRSCKDGRSPDRLHRDPLPAHQGAAAQEAGRAGQRRPDHRRRPTSTTSATANSRSGSSSRSRRAKTPTSSSTSSSSTRRSRTPSA